jgi:hypothetical protein
MAFLWIVSDTAVNVASFDTSKAVSDTVRGEGCPQAQSAVSDTRAAT